MAVTVAACPPPILQFFNNAGAPNVGGSVLTQVGGVDYPTYQDSAGSIPLPNPIPLNSRGEISNAAGASCQLFLAANVAYAFTLFDANGNLLDVASYVTSTVQTQASIGLILYPQTAAELAAVVTPTNYGYPTGDIRRYGASTGAADNSAFITSALKVSGAGGNAAFIPGGTWAITSPIVAAPGSSMYGAGTTNSVIVAATGIDALQLTTADGVYGGRTFRDFKLQGTLSGTTNNAHGVYAVAGSFLLNILFSNVAVLNFNWGFYLTNLEDSTIFACLIQNCWNGILFNNQSVNVFLLDNTVNLVSPGTPITGTGLSIGIGVQNPTGAEVEGLHIQGGTIYGYAYNIFLGLIFECQIEAVDISFATVCPIFFTSVIGPLVIRDCWIQLAASASGTWNNKAALGDANLTGIFGTAITPTALAKVSIENNYILCDVTNPLVGSTGIYLGSSTNGMVVRANHVVNFDVGIGGGNTLVNTGAVLTGATIEENTLNCVYNTTSTGVYSANSAALLLNSASQDLKIGPNYIVPGTGAAATASVGTTVTVPNQGTVGNQQFPVGTPVQCTTTAAGFTKGVTYYIATSAGAAVTLAATPGGAAIAGTAATSIGTLQQTPLPLVFNAGPATGTTFFARGKCTLTLSDPAVSVVADWVASGKTVSLALESIPSGAGATTTMTATGCPVMLAPLVSKGFMCAAENNTAWAYGYGVVASDGSMTLYPSPAAGLWTAAGTKAIGQSPIAWQL